jgi:hypothetical protein
MRIPLALLLLASLNACGVQYALVETKRQEIGRAYSVEPQIEWSKQTVKVVRGHNEVEADGGTQDSHTYQVWTVDGNRLESLLLFLGVPDRNPLFPKADPQKQKFPLFRGTMQASGVAELVVDSLSRLGNSEVETMNLRPANFGSLPGFRFELAYLSSSGLSFDGMAVGAVKGGVLYMVLFTGARSHYFPKYKGTVERLFDSIVFTEQTAALR